VGSVLTVVANAGPGAVGVHPPQVGCLPVPSSTSAGSAAFIPTPPSRLTAPPSCPPRPSRTQRFQAALAFDSVQLELPGIKEIDIDPSDLVVAKVRRVAPAVCLGRGAASPPGGEHPVV